MNKKKIINDPVYGFINIPYELIFELIEHPYFQRLRNIAQLGLAHLVYPGALHTRFSHALGSMHLMTRALEILESKGHPIKIEEAQAATAAILLHDIGYGPYVNVLEKTLVTGMPFRSISKLFIQRLNGQFKSKLTLALQMIENTYERKFFHQLLSGSINMNRLDYLARDSFFTGVSEGVIGYDRILSMLDVVDDQLVVEAKGVYSIEKLVIANRLMHSQVYKHKTVIAAENLMINVLKRAKELTNSGKTLFASPVLDIFLKNNYSQTEFIQNPFILDSFSKLDDFDVFTSIKEWVLHDDFILSHLSFNLINRILYKIKVSNKPFNIKNVKSSFKFDSKIELNADEMNYFLFQTSIKNNIEQDKIMILHKNGELKDITEASDNLNIAISSKTNIKYFLCYSKELVIDKNTNFIFSDK